MRARLAKVALVQEQQFSFDVSGRIASRASLDWKPQRHISCALTSPLKRARDFARVVFERLVIPGFRHDGIAIPICVEHSWAPILMLEN
jgi:hypothetical protein